MKVLQLLLRALVPLLERRAVAAERQAAATERLEDLLRTYLCYSDPQFRDLLAGIIPEAVPEVDDTSDYGSARDLKAARLEQLRTLYYEQHGVTLADEALLAEYERLYEEAEARLDAGVDGTGVAH